MDEKKFQNSASRKGVSHFDRDWSFHTEMFELSIPCQDTKELVPGDSPQIPLIHQLNEVTLRRSLGYQPQHYKMFFWGEQIKSYQQPCVFFDLPLSSVESILGVSPVTYFPYLAGTGFRPSLSRGRQGRTTM